jgi:ferric-dicitrate binding protein FerR (iron transport regulator)
MIDEKYIVLIHRSFRNEINEEEKSALQQWLEQKPEHQQAFQELEKTWQLSGEYLSGYKPNVEAGLSVLQKRIQEDKQNQTLSSNTKVRPLRSFYTVAAAIVFLLVAAAVWRIWFRPEPMFMAKTGPGETEEILLEDGSKVVLNENSTFGYPQKFGEQREVYLIGEAFFDIIRDTNRTFTIHTPMAQTEVLGTSFNLRAYTAEAFTEVEVLEGTVRLQPIDSQERLRIPAGARGTFQHNAGKLIEERPKALNALYWKEGLLRFRNHSLQEALDETEKRLGIKITLQDEGLSGCPVTTGIPLVDPDEIVSTITGILVDGRWEKRPSGDYIIVKGSCPDKAE